MTNQFFILVDKRDNEKFRRFVVGKASSHAKEILAQNKARYLWGLHKGQLKTGGWSEIRSGTEILFTVPRNNFEIMGRVSKKAVNKDWGQEAWSDQPNSADVINFLFFEKLEETNLPFSEITERSLDPVDAYLPGLYRMRDAKNKTPDRKGEPIPEKVSSEVNRFIRDSTLVKKLKKLYGSRCQICGYTIEYSEDMFYSEVHHYKPLERGGSDDIGNMLVLCPNHHAEFDYKMLVVKTDGRSVINRNGEKVAEIKFQSSHRLGMKNIQSQLK